MSSQSPFACVMTAIAPGQRTSHLENAKKLFEAVAEIRELENGYAFCLGNDGSVLTRVAEFIELEKLCCPFFGFAVIVEPEGGNIWLHLTGREGVKMFIQAEVAEIVGRPLGAPLGAHASSRAGDG